eukprot:TRINITY_DN4851_c0_g1_i1.p1 TRINITY_DN4851_c0_g1~~TRINITY_DN4851_c0_g1_i1.p1  ORF type:complete len:165 (-),score=19.89 TRINITY_DN4851_c0_g1_i1:57-551(-)
MVSVRRILSIRGFMSFLHLALSLLLLSSSIYAFVTKNIANILAFTLLLASFFMISTELYGFEFYKQALFMYSYGGRSVWYIGLSFLIWGMYTSSSFYIAVVAVTAFIAGLLSLVLCFFCTTNKLAEPVRPIFGPSDFIVDRSASLASQDETAETAPPSAGAFSL